MNQPRTLRLPQDQETAPQEKPGPHFTYRYAYSRSLESREFGDPGQDYLVIREDQKQIAFSLCDGVGQSFRGDLAATLLGDALVDWLWNELPSTQARVENDLTEQLGNLTTTAPHKINIAPLPEELPPLLREALEQQRTQGSESMFAAGLVDIDLKRLTLVWMGDSRIRLWGPNGEPINKLGEMFYTKERWSSNQGPIGQVRAIVTPLEGIRCLVAYSDGLALLTQYSQWLPDDNQSLEDLIAEAQKTPPDDDITFLEITLNQTANGSAKSLPPPSQPDAKSQTDQLSVSWQSVPNVVLSLIIILMMTTFFFWSVTASSSSTETPTATATATVTSTAIATATVTAAATGSATVTAAATSSATATFTASPSPTLTPSSTTTLLLEGTVNTDSLNVRAGPCDSYDEVTSLSEGDRVKLLAKNNDDCPDEGRYWYRIKDKNEKEGWVAGWTLDITDDEAAKVPEVSLIRICLPPLISLIEFGESRCLNPVIK